MKKFAAFLMILSVSVFTVGCGGKTDKTGEKTKTEVKTGEKTKTGDEMKTTPADKTDAKTTAPEPEMP